MSHPIFTNRLINEKSPYLLQHAHNPVDWYPWGEEAFQAAKNQDKPILLSIGYATCHWCHVMEEESFENEEVAKILNDCFINIKVDREEKPEVDSLYMEFAQAMMSGGAGWPLNVILTPDLTPFFAITYLPPEASQGLLGLKPLALRIKQIWQDPEERELVLAQAGKIVDLFADHIQVEGSELPKKESILEAADLLFKSADPIFGGTKGSPKFPLGTQGSFLLRFARRLSDSRALFYVERTLQMMARGGIHDHLGGGFSRYSIDERWVIPHFEKMLYDNALLSRTFLETYQLTRQPFYKEATISILNYVLRDMYDPKTAFFSAEDADSENQEGYFYTWSWEEIHQILGADSSLFCQFYGVTPQGNFGGRNVLHMTMTVEEFATKYHLSAENLKVKLEILRQKLFEVRKKRPHPLKDDKILTAWNGLMIYSMAEAGIALKNDRYLDAAKGAALFIKENLWKEGNLLRRYREGESKFDGSLDDYAFLTHGVLSLFEADQGSEWLQFAVELTQTLFSDFKVPNGAFYQTNGKDPSLILRRSEFYDGAEPSGNAIQAENLLRLYQITGLVDYLEAAKDVLKASKSHIDLYPPGACYHLMAMQRLLDDEAPTLVIALNEKEESKEEIKKMLSSHFLPHKAVIWKRESDEELRDLSSISRDKKPIDDKTTLYVCYQGRCLEPVNDIEKMRQMVERL